jgi:hypothetical protein
VVPDAETTLRLAGAIVLETLALCVWNVGTRSLQATLGDVMRALRTPRALASGIFSVLVGLVFVSAATILLLPALGEVRGDFVPVAIYTFVAALVIEFMIGNDLRAAIGRRPTRTTRN